MALPVKTSAQDVRDLVRYLKSKPTGATSTELKAAAKKLADGRKLSAFATWGFIVREDAGKLKLTDRGWLLARSPDRENEVFRAVLDSSREYRSVLEWLNHNETKTCTVIDIGVHWHEHHRDVVGDAKDATLRDNAVAFFSIAEAAGLGRLILGRGGNPTRFDVAQEALHGYIDAGPGSLPVTAPTGHGESDSDVQTPDGSVDGPSSQSTVPTQQPQSQEKVLASVPRVFISHGRNQDIVEQIEVMLGLAGIASEVAVKEETTAIPVPDKVLDAMRRCDAGIIAVTVDEGRKDESGRYVLNENVLIEIGAAFVLYDRKVVLLWDKRLDVPSNLQGLYRCEFEGEELSWSAGMKLMKAIQTFKN